MKVFILCGGYGTRLDDLGKVIAKPMVRVGNEPILFHIIENYCVQGFNDFVLCTGHKSQTVRNFFLKEKKNFIKVTKNKKNHLSLNFKNNKINFNCDLIFTGINNGTGGRIKIAYDKLKLDEDILMTYGDGISNVNINKLVKFHYKNKSIVTLTAVRPKQKYGVLKIKKNRILYFDESKQKSDIYINGGFFVISKKSIKYIKNKNVYWESEPLEMVIKKKGMYAHKHNGYWECLDTLKDQRELNNLFNQKKLLWKFR